MGVQENRAAVVEAYEAFGRGDVPSVVAMNAPDAVWVIHGSSAAPYNGEHKGLDGIGALGRELAVSREHLCLRLAHAIHASLSQDVMIRLAQPR